jgi:Bacterial aa3 type cytochrome c oxidase subunit IV
MGVDTSGGNSKMDYNAHNGTYASFLKITKYGIIALVLLLAVLKYFLIA